jgi:hypothetical protein
MPWERLRNLLLVDKLSLYVYLKTIPPRTGAADKETQRWAPYCAADGDCKASGATACDLSSHECIGARCQSDDDCFACQACMRPDVCIAPEPGSACLTRGR